MQESIKEHLKIQLNNSNRGEEDGCPLIVPKPGVEALHAHCNFAADQEPENSFDLYCLQVWELCVALWGNLSTLTQEGSIILLLQHYRFMFNSKLKVNNN